MCELASKVLRGDSNPVAGTSLSTRVNACFSTAVLSFFKATAWQEAAKIRRPGPSADGHQRSAIPPFFWHCELCSQGVFSTWFNFLLCRKLNLRQVPTKYTSRYGASCLNFLTIFSHCLQLSSQQHKVAFNQHAVSCWPNTRPNQRVTNSWKGDGRDDVSFAGELLAIWYQCRGYSCGAYWRFICRQTAASFPRAWTGASDDVMRSAKDLNRGSNCAENGVSDTLCLPVLNWHISYRFFPLTDIQRRLTCNWDNVRIDMLLTTWNRYGSDFLFWFLATEIIVWIRKTN